MLEEALQHIGSVAVEASRVRHTQFEELSDGNWLLTDPASGVIKIVNIGQFEHGTVCSIEDLLKVADTYPDTIKGVYVNKTQAVLQLRGADQPKARYVLPLRLNPVIDVLGACSNMTHIACMKMLRVHLASADITPDDFKTVMSALKFENTQENATTIKKGEESIGRSIRAKVTGEGNIPEEIRVSFPVYPDVPPHFVAEVRCSVIIDSVENRINVIPIPGEIERAVIEAQSHVASQIEAGLHLLDARSKVPVICGTFC